MNNVLFVKRCGPNINVDWVVLWRQHTGRGTHPAQLAAKLARKVYWRRVIFVSWLMCALVVLANWCYGSLQQALGMAIISGVTVFLPSILVWDYWSYTREEVSEREDVENFVDLMVEIYHHAGLADELVALSSMLAWSQSEVESMARHHLRDLPKKLGQTGTMGPENIARTVAGLRYWLIKIGFDLGTEPTTPTSNQ